MRPALLPLLLAASLLPAQAPSKAAPKAAKAAPKAASAKPTPEAEAARKALLQTLDAVDAGWFGQPYQGMTSVDMQGTLGIAL
ncbi:MAG: hypothetical protein IT187_08450, partial [Geothrix sp.]|nr:hypothetical protein [Geothrix sp.]